MHNKRLKLLKQNAARKADDLQEGESPPTQLFTGMSIYVRGRHLGTREGRQLTLHTL